LGLVLKPQSRAISLDSQAVPQSPFARTREKSFLLRQLLSSLTAGAMASIYPVTPSTAAISDAMAFGWLIVPIGVVVLAATGKLTLAEVVSALSLIAAGLTAALGNSALRPIAFAWLILAPIESVFSLNAALVGAIAAFAAMATLLLALARIPYIPAPEVADPMVFSFPGVMFIVIVGGGFAQLRALRRDAERTQARSYETLAEAMGCLVIGCGHSGVVSSVSSNCEALFGLQPSELMGRGFFEHIHVGDRPAFLKAISDARAAPATITAVVRWRGCRKVDRRGSAEPVFPLLEMRARRNEKYPRPFGGGRKADVTVIFRDVTGGKVAVAPPGSASLAGEASCANEHLLAQACHELREPLTAITGFSELISNPRLLPPDPEKQREYARIIHQSGQHLLAVVDSILHLAIIGASSAPIGVERFAVAPLIDLCCEMVKLQAEGSGVELLYACPANLDEIVTNRRLFTQILVNLLSNAIKFTPSRGSVIVSARLESDSLLILVIDTGIGITASDLDRIGDPFFQAKDLLGQQSKGTGLGLSIVRGFVGLLGGTIALASEPGKGTSVRVRLPLDCRDPAAKAGVGVKIETKTRLPAADEHDLHEPMMVKKIA
jgi:two-component system, cell cycle sensor histidine kinase DivJ